VRNAPISAENLGSILLNHVLLTNRVMCAFINTVFNWLMMFETGSDENKKVRRISAAAMVTAITLCFYTLGGNISIGMEPQNLIAGVFLPSTDRRKKFIR
jgi:hypothetical protein